MKCNAEAITDLMRQTYYKHATKLFFKGKHYVGLCLHYSKSKIPFIVMPQET